MASRGGGRSPSPAKVGRGTGGVGRAVGRGRVIALSLQPATNSKSPGDARPKPPVHAIQAAEGDPLQSVKARITALAGNIDSDDLKVYFQTACQFIHEEKVEMLTPVILGGGKAEVVLKGVSESGLRQLESRGHKIKDNQIKIEFERLPTDDEWSPPLMADSDGEGEGRTTTIKVANVANTASTGALKAFFEGAKSGGCAGAVADINKVKPGVFRVTFHDHNIAARVMSKPRKFKKEALQMKWVQETLSDTGESDSSEDEPNQIEVHNVPDTVNNRVLKAYFEGVKAGSCANTVAECKQIQKGVYLLTFHDPRVAAQVMSKSHTFKSASLRLQYVYRVKQKEDFIMNQLAVRNLPDGVEKEVYEVTIAGCLDMEEEEDFHLQLFDDSSAIITFAKSYAMEELQKMMDSIASQQVDGTTVTVEMVRATKPSIHVYNVLDTLCDEEFLQMYFGSSKRSGGGKVESVAIRGTTEAIITFVDPTVIRSVLGTQHPSLGPAAIVEEISSNSAPSPCTGAGNISIPTESLKISVDPLLVQSIIKSPGTLEQSILRSQVTFSADQEEGMLVFSPTGKSNPNWRQECREHVPQYIAENMTKEKISIPNEVNGQALVKRLEKKNPNIQVELNTDGTEITIAGETSCVLQAKEAIRLELVTGTASFFLSPEDFDFVKQVKQHELPERVECTFEQDTFKVTLKGPLGIITKLSDTKDDLVSHLDSPVMHLDPLVIEFFSTLAGRNKLESFLQERQCHVALHFSQSPYLTLHLLSDHKEARTIKAVIGQLPRFFKRCTIQIPETVAPIISKLEDFTQLCEKVEKEYQVVIKHIGCEISVAGFEAGVTSCLSEIRKFLDGKASPLPPLEMKVGPLIVKSLKRSPHGIQKCLHSSHVRLEYDIVRGVLYLVPLHYLNPEWKETCKRSVYEYIERNVTEMKVVLPEKAYVEVKSELQHISEYDDESFVYTYSPQTTSLSFAGEPNVVKSTTDRVSLISEELPLRPNEYKFLSQLKMQDLTTMFKSVDIECRPETHSLILSGPSNGVKSVKECMPTLTEHIEVPVELDEAVIQFLTSEKGKEKLFHLLHEKRCDKCAVYTSESPVRLWLLCASKHKYITEKMSEALLECTSTVTVHIPDVLHPFLSELSGVLKRLEGKVSAVLSVKDTKITLAGFKEGVSQADEMLSRVVREKEVHFQPVLIPVYPMMAKFIQGSHLQACMSSIHVTCTLTETQVCVSPTKATPPDWKEECERLFTSFVNEECVRVNIVIPNEVANTIIKFLHSAANLQFEPDDHDIGVYVIVGKRNVVEKVQNHIRGICSKEQTSDTIHLSHRQYDFFTQVVQRTLKSGVTIKCSAEKQTVAFHGSISDVNDIVRSKENIVQHNMVPVLVDEVAVQFIHTEGKQRFVSSIQEKGIIAALHINMSIQPPALELLCDPQYTQRVTELAQAIPTQIGTTTIPIPKTVTEPPISQEFRDQCQQLIREYHVLVQEVQDTLQICGYKDTIGDVVKSMQMFVKKICTISKSFPIQRGMWRLLGGPMKPSWIKIEAECTANDVMIKRPREDEGVLMIMLKGDKVQVQNIMQSLNHLVRSIHMVVMPLRRPEICRYFSEGEDGGEKIPGIEKRGLVCIEVCNVGEDMVCGIEDVKTEKSSTMQKPIKLCVKQCTAQVVDMKRITIFVGDITEFRADVIVNAANGELKHCGGVAAAILKKGGQEIQVSSDSYIQSHGQLSVGEVWFSEVVGRLPCRALVHAVGPKAQGNPLWKDQLKNACINCFERARSYSSIALPAISSGVYDCPIDQCAEVIITATIEFCDTSKYASLDDINIILFKQSDVVHFIRALQAHLPSQSVHTRSESSTKYPYDSSSHHTSFEASGHSGYTHSSFVSYQQQADPMSSSEVEEEPEEIVTVGSPSSLSRVFVQQGSILDMEAEIYVNSTNGNLDLSRGAVAQALTKAAGPSLQAECTNKAPIATGEIAVTGPGKILRCKCIIHINCPGYDKRGGQAEDVLRAIMNKCMKECDRRGASTIIFPAIGTGNLGFPVDTAAHIMVNEVCDYLQKNKCKALSMVYFIIYMDNMYRTFYNELQKRKQDIGSVAIKPAHKAKAVKKGKKKTRGCRHEHKRQQILCVQDDNGDHPLGLGNGITVQIIKGDITTENTDAIVNSTNREMVLRDGVAAALAKRAGPALQKACNEVKPKKKQSLSDGKVIVTRPGNLQCKRVFHIFFRKEYFVTIIIACIEKAIELRYSSIAFPGIGTGMERVPPDNAAKEMIKALQQCKAPSNLLVRIILIDDKVYKAFIAVQKDQQMTWYQRAGRAVKNWMPWGQRDKEDEMEEENTTDVEIRIFGETKERVDSAEKSLYTLINKQFITEEMEDEKICLLSSGEEDFLWGEARRMQLMFRIDRNLNSIELKGSKESIAEMKAKIQGALRQVEMEASKKAQAETMMKTVQWKRQDSTETDYEPETNLEIEQWYHKGKPTYTFNNSVSGEHFTINFSTMEETDHAMGDNKCKVKRITKGSEILPDDWEPMIDPTTKKEVPLRVVNLATASDGYQLALTEFHKTMMQGTNYSAIVRIERIQNPALYGQYAVQKKRLDTHNPKDIKNERWLFHGTDSSTVAKINNTNFNRSYSGQHGTMYGRGCYFARDASYSNRYAKPDSQQQKQMYFARVLTGEFTQGASNMISAPPKDPNDTAVLYDSVVDNTANPGIYVVFYDAAAYPEYLITYA